MNEMIFSEGLCFDKLFCVFLTGGMLGDLVETVFCRITAGRRMRRSSLVYGHLSIVWGIAFVIATALYPMLNSRIESIPPGPGRLICDILFSLFAADAMFSFLTVIFRTSELKSCMRI